MGLSVFDRLIARVRRLSRARRAAYAFGALAVPAAVVGAYGHFSRPPEFTLTVHTQSPKAASPGKEKVVVILVDSLRRDHLGVNGYSRPVSPTLDRLASEGLHATNMVAQSSQTVPSTVSVLTSRLPHQTGIQFYSKTQGFTPTKERGAPALGADVTTMAEYFSANGFYTAAVVANPWLKAAHGFGQGFDRYVEVNCHGKGTRYVCDGRILNDQAKSLLREHRDEKSLLYLHYMDVHHPYASNPRVRRAFRPRHGKYVYRNGTIPPPRPEDLEYTRALYDEGILYMDGLLADLLEFLEREGLDEDTTVVVTSDHGDEFHEHGGSGHGTTLYGELVNTFAVFWNERRFPRGRVEGYTQSVDILPTLMDAFGIERPDTLMGVSLLSGRGAKVAEPGREIVSELGDRKAILSGEWKYLIDLGTGLEELYEVGPRGAIERENRLERVDLVFPMREKLAPVVRQARSGAPALQGVDPETEERLKALGYMN
jgi:arylsulfatase A-like enzyme